MDYFSVFSMVTLTQSPSLIFSFSTASLSRTMRRVWMSRSLTMNVCGIRIFYGIVTYLYLSTIYVIYAIVGKCGV